MGSIFAFEYTRDRSAMVRPGVVTGIPRTTPTSSGEKPAPVGDEPHDRHLARADDGHVHPPRHARHSLKRGRRAVRHYSSRTGGQVTGHRRLVLGGLRAGDAISTPEDPNPFADGQCRARGLVAW